MARPQKEGIDYFPVDCQFNDDVKLIQAEFGLIGLGILIRIWQKIYGGKGFYTDWNNDVMLMFASECGVGVNVVKEVVFACFRRGLFDRQMYDQYQILTSEGIQERYAEATERRSSQKIDGRYLLIVMPKNWVNVNNNSINADNNSENADDNPQSKVNKSKVNNNIINTRTRALFEELYEAYPRKGKVDEAFAAFEAADISEEDLKRILRAVEIQKKSPEWNAQSGQFIPGLVRYLSERRWESVSVESESIEDRIIQASKQRVKEKTT